MLWIVGIIIVVAVIDVASPGEGSNTQTTGSNVNASNQVVASNSSIVPLPTVASQIPDYSSAQAPSPGNASEASSSDTGTSFSSRDVAPYLTAVGEIICDQGGQLYDLGSGSVWQFAGSSQSYVLTNYHVIEDDDSCTFLIYPTGADGTEGDYDLDISAPMRWNQDTDIAVVPIIGIDDSFASSTPIADLNYSIATLTACPTQMPQEAPVAVLGFPASTQNAFSVINGVISGYDNSNPDAYNDYYVTAPVDNGDSGGVALSKYNNEVCILGVPTWVSVGEHQNEGDTLDINNILYINDSR